MLVGVVYARRAWYLACFDVVHSLDAGGGGTNRLPKLLGVQNALPFLLQGAQKKAKQAKSAKLVDVTTDPYQVGRIRPSDLKWIRHGVASVTQQTSLLARDLRCFDSLSDVSSAFY